MGCFVRTRHWGAFAAIVTIVALALTFATRAIAYDFGFSAELRHESEGSPDGESEDAQSASGIAGAGSQFEEEEDDDDQLHVLLVAELMPEAKRVRVTGSSSQYQRERCQPPTPPPLT